MADIAKQFDNAVNNFLKDEYYFIVPQLVQFGIKMVNDIIPDQADYRNLTGNTLTSYAFGVYWQGKLDIMGFGKRFKPPIRNKLVKGETVYDFVDYDGVLRKWFTAKIDTDAGFGKNSSVKFLKDYVCRQQYGIVFTTGTEYSEYLEEVMKLNVLTQSYQTAKSSFIKSFKPIK